MFIQSSVECLSCFQGLAVVSSTARNSPVQGFEHPFPMVLSICLGMVLLGHMVILCITAHGQYMNITITLHLPELFFSFLFLVLKKFLAILVGANWCLLVVLTCVFLMTNDMEHLFLCFLATVLLLNSHYVLRWVLSS